MKIKSVLAAGALALAGAGAMAATPLGTLTEDPSLVGGSGTGLFFLDYTFSLATLSDVFGGGEFGGGGLVVEAQLLQRLVGAPPAVGDHGDKIGVVHGGDDHRRVARVGEIEHRPRHHLTPHDTRRETAVDAGLQDFADSSSGQFLM